ncbi:E3 ubiquitin-protein ligase rififylin isoform X2 [Cynoglossus semilaevis]|uniref:E3 ubiquitin-protein ligase rififylin isoform X2 n=1 Tax=Cynoglossus semilaevis TaxID=244447 RepID=UPI0007DC968C|nr:E3 ubiquitin-protein ligase rififylin isoform X2 [Cynoglossus semilaevis]
MWASCCNWLCMDSADSEQTGESEQRRHHQQSYSNSAFNTQSPPPEHTCKACGGCIDTAAKKHVCVDCKNYYCSRCSAQLEPRPCLCHTCQRFYGNLLERTELMKLKVKELRDYLHLHQVSTHLCREKEELVELVLSRQSSPSSDYAPDDVSTEPASRTSHPPDLTSHISVLTPDPDEPTSTLNESSDLPSVQHDALTSPSETTPTEIPAAESGTQEDDQTWDCEEPAAPGRRASLADLKCVDDIEALSVRQLKEILARNFVNYKGCCEKWELMERVTRLYQDQQNLLESEEGAPGLEDNVCRICMDSPIDCVLLECGHMITCTKCGKRMSECPICRQYVIRVIHVFKS